MTTGLALVGLVRGDRSLGGFLRTLPRRPGLAFDAINLLDLDLAGQVEVADGGLTPLHLNTLQVRRNCGLADPDFYRDLLLGPALQIQIRHSLTANVDT
ncbi:hypothetical protein Pr1d_36300 [Bythopirellula goksoeyrii]|uniref:Uncharacterized protein n=1 Tax=Bythopirellula goksoeyrii TaxID=1400387 RepID=A0A5B9QBA4_9BACT|nr:hypothetical protein Pr1d_36300 [Bythopirellula goksoeyrii]